VIPRQRPMIVRNSTPMHPIHNLESLASIPMLIIPFITVTGMAPKETIAVTKKKQRDSLSIDIIYTTTKKLPSF